MSIHRTKPRIFIGSSVEGLVVAEAMQVVLDHDAEVTIWSQGVFGLSHGTLEELVRALDKFEYAILVLSQDDLVLQRDAVNNSPRDNVIFELGLFMGALGRDKTFIVYSRDAKPDIPTDLAGVTAATYATRSDGNLKAALGAACTQIKDAIAASIRTQEPSSSTSLAFRSKAIGDDNYRNTPNTLSSCPANNEKERQATQADYSDHWAADSIEWFQRRVERAFPGVRGVKVYDSPQDIVRRLARFFQNPPNAEKQYTKAPNTWWFRGGSNNPISNARQLSYDKILVDVFEIHPIRLAVYRPGSFWYQLIYLEAAPEMPIVQRDITPEQNESEPILIEDFAILNGRTITAAEHYDGNAEIDGALVDATGSEYRRRFLAPANLLIVPQGTPLNDEERDGEVEVWLRELLQQPSRLEAFFEDYFRGLPQKYFR